MRGEEEGSTLKNYREGAPVSQRDLRVQYLKSDYRLLKRKKINNKKDPDSTFEKGF